MNIKIVIIYFYAIAFLFGQNSNWIIYDTANSDLPDNYIWSMALDNEGNKWLGTFDNGLAKFDGNNWVIYTTDNSNLPGNYIQTLDIDSDGNIWIASAEHSYEGPVSGLGLTKFDRDTTWITYNCENSQSPCADIIDICIHENIIWLGSTKGIIRFDGMNWTVYDTSDYNLSGNNVESIAIDSSGNLWAGVYNMGLVMFDGSDWTHYNTSNSDLPEDGVRTIEVAPNGDVLIGTDFGYIEFDGTDWHEYDFSYGPGLFPEYFNGISFEMGFIKWLATDAGLLQLYGMNWEIYNTYNSEFPIDIINGVVVEENGNKWASSFGGGLVVFNENGVVSIKDDSGLPEDFILFQNHPNPFNNSTTIQYELKKYTDVKINVYDLLGKKIVTLISERQNEGSYTLKWNGRDEKDKQVSSGVYFYQIKVGNIVQTRKMVLMK